MDTWNVEPGVHFGVYGSGFNIACVLVKKEQLDFWKVTTLRVHADYQNALTR